MIPEFVANLIEKEKESTDINYFEYLAMIATVATKIGLPVTEDEARASSEWLKWKAAMDTEMESHRENKTWNSHVSSLPAGIKAIGYRCIFVKKLDMFGKISKFKAGLVAKGYNQRHGIDYLETYAPVCKFKSIRTLMAIAASKKY